MSRNACNNEFGEIYQVRQQAVRPLLATNVTNLTNAASVAYIFAQFVSKQ